MRKLFQTQCPLLVAGIVCALALFTACRTKNPGSPPGYDLNHPQTEELGKVLNEISGLAYDKEHQSLLAISDSKEKIVEINLRKQKLKDYTDRISVPGQDFEDLVLLNNTVYLLSSNGTIKAVPAHARNDSEVMAYPFWSQEKNDFEALYYDPDARG